MYDLSNIPENISASPHARHLSQTSLTLQTACAIHLVCSSPIRALLILAKIQPPRVYIHNLRRPQVNWIFSNTSVPAAAAAASLCDKHTYTTH